MGRFDIMGRHAPEPGVVLPKNISPTAAIGISRHNSIARASKRRLEPLPFRAQGTATLKTPCSGQLLRGSRASKMHLVLEEVQMPPALDAGVMSRAKLAALWAAKAPALLGWGPEAAGVVRLQIGIRSLSIPLRVARPP